MAKPDKQTDAELLKEARERHEEGMTAERENDVDALDDLRFISGDQWDQTVKTAYEAEGKPCLTINKLPQFIRQVTGDLRINKPAIKVHPVDSGADVEMAETYSGLIRHIEAVSDADIAYNVAAQNATGCGKGAFRIVVDHFDDDSFDQEIRIEQISNPFAVVFDPNAKKYTREDGRYCFVVEEIGREDFKRRYPEASLSEFDTSEAVGTIVDWGTQDTIRVAEYWTKTPVIKTIGRMQVGSTLDLTDMAEPERAQFAVEDTREVESFKIESRIISGAEVLEGPFEHPGRFIPIVPVWGEEWHVGDKVVRNGLIRYAKDPQRMYNYHMSAATEMISLAPKAPYIGTVDQFKGLERYWNNANIKNFAYLPYKPDKDAQGPPQRQHSAEFPAAMTNMSAIATGDMNETTGIYPPSLGARSNETSGVAIRERKQEGDVGTFSFIDNLARSIRYGGRILVDLIPKIYDGERIVRILGEDETEEMRPINVAVSVDEMGNIQFANDITVGKYDVSITTGPSYSTKRAEASDSMLAFMSAVPEAAGLIGDLIAKNQDWPGGEEIAKRLHRVAVAKGIAEPEEGDPPPPPDPAAETEVKEFQLKVTQAQAQMTKDKVETEGKELDNAQKQIDLSRQTGGIEDLVKQEVQRLIVQALQDVQPSGVPQPNGGGSPGIAGQEPNALGAQQ